MRIGCDDAVVGRRLGERFYREAVFKQHCGVGADGAVIVSGAAHALRMVMLFNDSAAITQSIVALPTVARLCPSSWW